LEINNKKAYHDYFIENTFVAGMVLQGSEIKSLREGKASFADSFCIFDKGALYVRNLNIAEYAMGTIHNHIPVRDRKLLLQKQELRRLETKTKEKGFTIIPLRIFISEKGLAKIEIGLGKGKKHYDKRETLKARETDRMLKRSYNK